MRLPSLLLLLSTTSLYPQHPSLGSAASPAFEANKGQVHNTDGSRALNVLYHIHYGGLRVFALADGLAYQFTKMDKHDQDPCEQRALPITPARIETARMDMHLVGASSTTKVEAEDPVQGLTHYYTRGVLDVPSYSTLIYHEVYPGIDWELSVHADGSLEHDFVVHPGADPSVIALRYEGHRSLRVNARGALVIGNALGEVTENTPVSFQEGHRLSTRFEQHGDMVRFVVADHDPSVELRIDPAVLWATYYGDSGDDAAESTAIDASGNIYLAGLAGPGPDIASLGHQTTFGGANLDALLVKFDPSGGRIWSTYYGGTSSDLGYGCAVDANGNVFLSGSTDSQDNIASGGFQNTSGGYLDGFLVKFNAQGVRQWATYCGGSAREDGLECATDANGNAYLCGLTASSQGIASGGHQNTYGGGLFDAFLVKVSPTGQRVWGTYYGGTGQDNGYDVATDNSGSVFLCGLTNSSNAISAGGFQNDLAGYVDGFLVKFNADGTRTWGTYYGGVEVALEEARGCAVDASGNVYLAGASDALSGIAANGAQAAPNGSWDAFLVKFDANGARSWGTYNGGTSQEWAWDCAVDNTGRVYVAGNTSSTSGIALNGIQNDFGGAIDGFITCYEPDGTRIWGSYYGGSLADAIRSCAAQSPTVLVFCGATNSSNGIAQGGFLNTPGGGLEDAFLAKVDGLANVGLQEATLGAGRNNLWPNPTTGEVHLAADALGAPGTYALTVIDALGRSVSTERITLATERTNTVFELPAALPAGLYTLRIQGEVAKELRLVLQR